MFEFGSSFPELLPCLRDEFIMVANKSDALTTPHNHPFRQASLMSLSPLASVPSPVEFSSTASPDAVARQVEGLFASLLLKELRGNGTEGGLFGGDSSDVLGGMFDQYMGQSIADAGGLGLRDYLMNQARTSMEPTATSETL